MSKKKKTFLIVFWLLLVYSSIYSEYQEFDNVISFENISLLMFINFLIITFVMMLVPFIFRVINKKKLSFSKGKRICALNSVVLFCISLVLYLTINIGVVGGFGVIVYYFINKWLFVEESK